MYVEMHPVDHSCSSKDMCLVDSRMDICKQQSNTCFNTSFITLLQLFRFYHILIAALKEV